jgi:hypothetical protein
VLLIAKKGKNHDKRDRLKYVRRDGTHSEIDMPRQGILPHDLVHCIVEQAFGYTDGFMGRVADGASPQFAESVDMTRTRELSIAESAVEAMQTQLASGQFDYEAFAYGLEMACAVRKVTDVVIPQSATAREAFDRATQLNAVWRSVPPMQTLEVHFLE